MSESAVNLEPLRLDNSLSATELQSIRIMDRNLSTSHYQPPAKAVAKQRTTERGPGRARATSLSPSPHDQQNRLRYNRTELNADLPADAGMDMETPLPGPPQHLFAFMSANPDVQRGQTDDTSHPLRSRAETIVEEENDFNPATRLFRAQQTTTRLLWCLVVMVAVLLGLHLGEWAKKWNESGL